VDALPPPPVLAPQPLPTGADARLGPRNSYAYAPGDIYPKGPEEERLCGAASKPDWLYLLGLLAGDSVAITLASLDALKSSSTPWPLRFVGPIGIGVSWGATVGGAWLALPKCSPEWIGESPREGAVRASWPVALSLALLAGATAPVVDAIVSNSYSSSPWSDFEREMHIVAAALAGFGGALLPYVLPPRTWAAAQELDHLRVGADGHGTYFVGFVAKF
jgi:hypothetical protein